MSSNIINPSPGAIVDSLRSIGYTLETAVADIIDNSITAGAENIWISAQYGNYTDAKLFILDDGNGMSEDVLREAMRLGTNGPETERTSSDLGRFGLGLKTASFSQCRRFAVLTKTKDGIKSALCWDIDVIKEKQEWYILRDEQIPLEFWEKFENLQSGTLVVWEKMDRVLTDGTGQNQYYEKLNNLRTHLSLIFHRFLEKKSLMVFVNKIQLYPLNPFSFFSNNNAGSLLPEVRRGEISIRGHVLPHRDKLTSEEYKSGALGRTWTQMQGFYVYRGNRLIMAGGWLGLRINDNLIRQDRYHDLARIEVNIPNKVDMEWQLDVMKSRVLLPDQYQPTLMEVANQTRARAYDAYMYRDPLNKKSPRHNAVNQLWMDYDQGNGQVGYAVNKEHPIISAFEKSLTTQQKDRFTAILQLLARKLPLENIGMKVSDNQCATAQRIEDKEQLTWLEEQLLALLIDKGKTKEEAISEIKKYI